jgi:hypothetical protein
MVHEHFDDGAPVREFRFKTDDGPTDGGFADYCTLEAV